MAMATQKPPVHPGVHMKRSVIPDSLSVKKAAEMLGVGRPALSNLLNGKAALSPEMAMRFEKAFSVDGTSLLQMQARYDEFKARAREDEIAVRAYAPAYLQITARQIAAWSETVDARAQLPALLRMLVHSTGTNLNLVDFPAFDNSQRKGWDGQVNSGSATPWIPLGKSGWEFGCNEDARSKAESDYTTRTDNVAANEQKTTTFVFVTPRNWPGKGEWSKAKKAESEWKDVRAFDASDLEQWLEQSIPAQTRFREFQGGAAEQVASLDRIWDEWAGATEPQLNKALFAPAADRHWDTLKRWFNEPPARPLVVAADSSLEGLAFLACAVERLHESDPDIYDRAVAIRSLEAFSSIAKGSPNFVAIIASSEVELALAGLHKKTHTIIVRGRNVFTGDIDITLDLLGYEAFRDALRQMGLDDRRIDQLARESARSPTILRRRLAEVPAVRHPPWGDDHAITRALIPLIFVGAWDSSATDDQKILRRLTGSGYDEVEQTIARLQQKDEAPVWSIGKIRGVVSKIDALYAAHKSITPDDLKNFLFAAEVVLSEQDPALELPEDKRWAANLYGKSRDHSPALRQGICDTLVLMAVHGNALIGKRLGIDLEAEVGGVVRRLLTPFTESTWLSQQYDLPQYAEAAPDTFLKIVEDDLNSEAPRIAALFTPAESGIFGDCPRTGLLWALESLAWKPQRLVRVVSILARLCQWKIDDNWANTPLATLASIFRFWMPQTAAALDERNRALETLTKRFPEIGWQICVCQFNPGSTTGHENYRPRWCTDAHEAGEVATVSEGWQAQRNAIELALDWSPHDVRTLGDLVERLEALNPEHRDRVWDLIFAWNDTGPGDEQKAALRERIRRRALTRRGRRRNLDDALQNRAREAYALLEPSDLVARHGWLFLHGWVEESIDEIEDEEFDHHKREERIARQRRDALVEVRQQAGLKGILDLCRSGEASRVIGIHLAEIHTGIESAADFVHKLLSDESADLQDKLDQCIAGILMKLDEQKRSDTLSELLVRLAGQNEACIRLLRCAPFDGDTWHRVDRLSKSLKRRYWEEVSPRWGGFDAPDMARLVDRLLEVDRPRAAFDMAHLEWKLLDSPRLVRLLNEVATNDSEPSRLYQIKSYDISAALDVLEERGDISRDQLAQLEFTFIKVLDDTEHGIRNLEVQLSETPALFLRVLALVFKRNDGGEDPAEWQLPNSDNRAAVASAAHSLLTKARRIPGSQADGSIDLQALKEWVEQSRVLARQYGRAEKGDQMIGQLLSHCPAGADGVWPCEPIRDAIEDIASSEIADGMYLGIRNARGAVWHDEDDMQDDRELADQYRRWSHEIAFEHPYTSDLLKKIACSYDRDARWRESQAGVRQRLGN